MWTHGLLTLCHVQLFDYYGEPSYGPYERWPRVSSTFGAFDLAGFAKPATSWYRSWWLHDVPDTSADKPFTTAGKHTVRIVESWEQPSQRPLSNGTTLVPCSDKLPGQRLSFTGSAGVAGVIRTPDGLCVDGTCANLTVSKCSILRFVPCQAAQASQQWTFDVESSQLKNGENGGCLESGYQYPFYDASIRDEERSEEVGVAPCGGSQNQKWDQTTTHRLQNLGVYYDQNLPIVNVTWCLSNGRGDDSGRIFQALHVYSDLEEVELFVNGASQGTRSLLSPSVTPTATARSWAEWNDLAWETGNLTAVGRDSSGAVRAVDTVMTSGAAAKVQLSIDAPSIDTGTGEALLLDGQDVALIRATIVDASGRLVADATHNVSFSITSGPGKIFGSHNGDPSCHEPNRAPSHSSYHGLSRAIDQVTEDRASPAWHRRRLNQIDAHAGALTKIVEAPQPLAPIVLRATVEGLPPASVAIPVSADPAATVMAVAAASAGKPVVCI